MCIQVHVLYSGRTRGCSNGYVTVGCTCDAVHRTALTDLNQVLPMNVMPVAASKAVAVRRYVPDT